MIQTKKALFLSFIALSISCSTMAQKPTSPAKSSIEGQIGYQLNTIQFSGASLRYRYFLKDNLALRVGFGLLSSDSTRTVFELPGGSETGGTGEVRSKNNSWNLNLGTEYHFPGTEKLSPYIGAEFRIGGGKTHLSGTNVEENNTFADKKSYDIELPQRTLGLGAVAGMDYYFRQNLYLGLELGLGWNQTTLQEGAKTIVIDNVSVITKTNGKTKINSWSTGSIALFRIGWRF